ncbi:hypothetical protein [Pleionea sp. CnH1-48]|uniref:hypothetical protein n=1 Tax=Pleionea sp. CnH1-48 TaxID=2954494 RepID=UPI0020984412|nr:hypothetical protein [Pleionea sp. CnH1-48]MCO7223561.1 hypothetical protein [Pleionea sp. CnH1-48]
MMKIQELKAKLLIKQLKEVSIVLSRNYNQKKLTFSIMIEDNRVIECVTHGVSRMAFVSPDITEKWMLKKKLQ